MPGFAPFSERSTSRDQQARAPGHICSSALTPSRGPSSHTGLLFVGPLTKFATNAANAFSLLYGFLCFFSNPHPRALFHCCQREREKERNINQLPLICSLTRVRTHSPLVCGMVVQPTEPPGQDPYDFLDTIFFSRVCFIVKNTVYGADDTQNVLLHGPRVYQ